MSVKLKTYVQPVCRRRVKLTASNRQKTGTKHAMGNEHQAASVRVHHAHAQKKGPTTRAITTMRQYRASNNCQRPWFGGLTSKLVRYEGQSKGSGKMGHADHDKLLHFTRIHDRPATLYTFSFAFLLSGF